jgi:hypothetical protein
MVSLVIFPEFRERTLRRLANLQERDEREEYITGKAARASYVATLSLTLLFLFFSMTSFHYARLEQTDPSKPKHSVSVSFGYSFFTNSEADQKMAQGVQPIFDSPKYALSGSTLMLMLLGWQLLIFNLSARKLSK